MSLVIYNITKLMNDLARPGYLFLNSAPDWAMASLPN